MSNILAIQGESIVLPLQNAASTFPLFKRIAHLPYACFLDSAVPSPTLGRYSYMSADPFGVFKVQDKKTLWQNKALNGPPLASLRQLLAAFSHPGRPNLPPFQGGAM
ncbi:MAG TPA: hypothetical protein DCS30_18485, partial [Rhizobiales bacterium]|nr:hypothetical protein [Hyphomicrobiales bacterium]